jgi:hypothetical protein
MNMYIEKNFWNFMYESKLQMKIIFKLQNHKISLKVKIIYCPLQVWKEK